MMKQYDSYKDSGVEWIGKIPSHWEVVKLKYDFNIYAGATPKTEVNKYWDGDITWVTPADYKTDDKYILSGQRTLTKEGYDSCNTQIVPKGSLIFSKRAPIGTVAVSGVELCTNQGCLSCVPLNSNVLYFYYLTSVLTEVFDLFGSGATFKEISADTFANFRLPFPSLEEQDAIASYLDEKCGKIDKAIATQEKRVELLKELRQNIITQAVTRGINPDVPLKDSGVEWIGAVPEHWKVMKSSIVYSNIGSGTTPSTSNSSYYTEEGDGYCWLQTGDLNDGIINDTSKRVTELAIKECNLKFFPVDSVVIAMYGATIGKVGLLKIRTATNQACCVLPHSSKMIPYFSFYLFLSAKTPMLLEAMGGGQPNISQDVIKKLRIPVPPISEQQEIVSYIESKTVRLDKSIEKAEHQIELLQELKQSIITEVVTGKRKVC